MMIGSKIIIGRPFGRVTWFPRLWRSSATTLPRPSHGTWVAWGPFGLKVR
jgi:hypothetical protein